MMVPRDLTSEELVYRMLGDPLALHMLLRVLIGQARDKTLHRKARDDCFELARVLLPNASRY